MSEKIKTTIGGQALIEGILMRGPVKSAIVVRKPDGELVITESDNKKPSKITKFPIIRGMYALYISMKDGTKALNYSASFMEDATEEELSSFEKWLMNKFGAKKVEAFFMGLATVLGVLFPIGLFIMLPTLLASVLAKIEMHFIIRNLFEGLIRIVIFLIFMFLTSRLKDVQRTFSYHGAEHKTIACYEAGLPLTVENVRKQNRLHPRCGTSFLFVVMIVSILLFSLVSWDNVILRMVYRLLLLPVVIGISYEFNRFAGRHDNAVTRFLVAPGLWMQKHFTTFEPDDDMIEVAITAMEIVIPSEKGSDNW